MAHSLHLSGGLGAAEHGIGVVRLDRHATWTAANLRLGDVGQGAIEASGGATLEGSHAIVAHSLFGRGGGRGERTGAGTRGALRLAGGELVAGTLVRSAGSDLDWTGGSLHLTSAAGVTLGDGLPAVLALAGLLGLLAWGSRQPGAQPGRRASCPPHQAQGSRVTSFVAMNQAPGRSVAVRVAASATSRR